MKSVEQKLQETVAYLKPHLTAPVKFGITLGSGLAGLAGAMKVTKRLAFSEIPHFCPPTIEGHPGQLLIGTLQGAPLIALQGRVHFYEGHSLQEVVFPTRVLGQLGVRVVMLTNAAGGLMDGMKPGDLMVIEDHINLTGQNPLIGPNIASLGPRFPDMTEIYTPKYRDILKDIFTQKNMPLFQGVYCGVTGPSYETPAEIRFFRTIGCGAVGMSTVNEAIAARHMGMSVVGLSCITNVAAGLRNSQILSHEDVKAVATKVESSMIELVTAFVERINSLPIR
jgi:purine-nucleoside phosphorylase